MEEKTRRGRQSSFLYFGDTIHHYSLISFPSFAFSPLRHDQRTDTVRRTRSSRTTGSSIIAALSNLFLSLSPTQDGIIDHNAVRLLPSPSLFLPLSRFVILRIVCLFFLPHSFLFFLHVAQQMHCCMIKKNTNNKQTTILRVL